MKAMRLHGKTGECGIAGCHGAKCRGSNVRDMHSFQILDQDRKRGTASVLYSSMDEATGHQYAAVLSDVPLTDLPLRPVKRSILKDEFKSALAPGEGHGLVKKLNNLREETQNALKAFKGVDHSRERLDSVIEGHRQHFNKRPDNVRWNQYATIKELLAGKNLEQARDELVEMIPSLQNFWHDRYQALAEVLASRESLKVDEPLYRALELFAHATQELKQ